MIWLAWRRRRGAVIVTGARPLVAAALLFLTGRSMCEYVPRRRAGGVHRRTRRRAWVPVAGGCQDEAQAFASRFFLMRLLGLALFTFVPIVARHVLGCTAIAREVEHDTVSLVWTQGISGDAGRGPSSGFVGAVRLVTMGIFAVIAVTWWYGPLNAATGDRFQWLIYDQQGLAPVGYAVFAMALAAFLGAVTGRTVRAMAISGVGFVRRGSRSLCTSAQVHGRLERTYRSQRTRPEPPARRLALRWRRARRRGRDPSQRRTGRGRTTHLPAARPRLLLRRRTRRLQPGAVPPGERFWSFQAIETRSSSRSRSHWR